MIEKFNSTILPILASLPFIYAYTVFIINQNKHSMMAKLTVKGVFSFNSLITALKLVGITLVSFLILRFFDYHMGLTRTIFAFFIIIIANQVCNNIQGTKGNENYQEIPDNMNIVFSWLFTILWCVLTSILLLSILHLLSNHANSKLTSEDWLHLIAYVYFIILSYSCALYDNGKIYHDKGIKVIMYINNNSLFTHIYNITEIKDTGTQLLNSISATLYSDSDEYFFVNINKKNLRIRKDQVTCISPAPAKTIESK